MDLTDNTILITGGTSGIGLALARALSAHRNTVIVCGRNAARLEALRRQEPQLTVYRCDIADDEAQQQLVETLRREHPRLNILINNVGIQHNYSLIDGADHLDRIDEEVTVNLLSHMRLTERLLPHLMSQPRGAIVNITSALALVPKENAPVYCATKAAMRSFTQALRYQLEHTSVAVFEIIPSLVETAMTEGRGSGKISTGMLAEEALRALATDRYEVRIGKTKLLFVLHRLLPAMAARMVRNG